MSDWITLKGGQSPFWFQYDGSPGRWTVPGEHIRIRRIDLPFYISVAPHLVEGSLDPPPTFREKIVAKVLPKSSTCPECEKVFKSPRGMEMHRRRVGH